MKIAVDFDGTCVDHRYPDIGPEAPGAVRTMLDLIHNGHQLILWTMRSGEALDAAVEWFKRNDIDLFGVQSDPEQSGWTASPKCYAHIYIDDAAFGAPLVLLAGRKRPCIDWSIVRKHFMLDGVAA